MARALPRRRRPVRCQGQQCSCVFWSGLTQYGGYTVSALVNVAAATLARCVLRHSAPFPDRYTLVRFRDWPRAGVTGASRCLPTLLHWLNVALFKRLLCLLAFHALIQRKTTHRSGIDRWTCSVQHLRLLQV